MKYRVELKSFEGPMDLLLHLIKEAEIDIYDIPINVITEEFLEHIKLMEDLNLEVTSDFLLMASTLLEIKSKMMLPKNSIDKEEEEEDPRDDLVDKILEYKKFKELSEVLRNRETRQAKVYYKPKEEIIKEEIELELEEMEVGLLLKAINNIIKNRTKEDKKLTISEIQREEYTLEFCIIRVKERLEKKNSIYFSGLLSKQTSVEEIITYFLSILELAKGKFLSISQKQDFSDLILEKRSKDYEEI